MSAMDDLTAFQRQTEALAQVMGRLSWDQETMMPEGAVAQRGEELAALEGVLHSRRVDARVADWLAAAKPETEADAAQIRLIRRAYDRAAKVPAELSAAIVRATALAHRVWAEARANEDVASFLPVLREILTLRQEEAAALSGDGDAYDALLQDYEPGMSGAALEEMFGALRPRLVVLRAAVAESGYDPAPLDGVFSKEQQLALTHELAAAFGYDFNHGRIDEAVHPFSSGSGADVRITTRVDEREPFGCLYSTIHEVGHATYEQNIAPEFRLTSLGQGVSMGVHESQSRIYENQLARSRAFTGWLYGRMVDRFGALNVDGEEAFHAAVNRVQPGYIRTEADEVHYNLHILMRFDLERALLAGDLAVSDLEAAWNDRFEADFGVAVDKPSNGMLQDVHWSAGLIGYFPTYSLGNVYAGCLHAALRRDLPELDTDLARGDLRAVTGWLKERLQQYGGLRSPRETIQHAIGGEISEAPLLDYLEDKFTAIYRA
ncbi:carboxypeptidase M32 [Roseobacter sp. HKCCD9010]|uniref:carboxypeptidase M32 n=1 Tax=unclassified Roseobacter TaxID=196798 RepID=UPI0014932035|nr:MULTISPECIES: carboxypeptidase M32 [unclassified Roseobacter]MBF9050515.1 carboxypeptidase M32 [Rhodobacterales bacterium HKCCD4356]NNV12068.1 carboxypeptidase M32 [Roseobacter sp. HKCCD7357]NNV17082.1 carboxypeptidase M32 [Roseobacter sp. HKCCD8768]NNV26311.1 carboxypeptidase M32 [Roseobacter sp. HKCCD8192]NNV30806.1 carboxypeptidase M32 [Roseobacter sp. HKCCD9061]